jgi:hypothetical protein
MNLENSESKQWYIIKQSSGTCAIATELPQDVTESWGPFDSQNDAISRRIGLIRAGKCQPT